MTPQGSHQGTLQGLQLPIRCLVADPGTLGGSAYLAYLSARLSDSQELQKGKWPAPVTNDRNSIPSHFPADAGRAQEVGVGRASPSELLARPGCRQEATHRQRDSLPAPQPDKWPLYRDLLLWPPLARRPGPEED